MVFCGAAITMLPRRGNEVVVNVQPALQNKTVNPTTSQQNISADSPNYGLGTVTVNAVDITIDSNILSNNIKNGVTILGITGSYTAQPDLEAKTVTYTVNDTYTVTPSGGKDGLSSVEVTVAVPSNINNQNKTVSPTTTQQSYTADSGYTGLGTVTVEAVTSSIDPQIQAGNIKDGVTILGVQGTYEPDLETKSVTYTSNNTYTITPTQGKDGMNEVTVTVNVPGYVGNCPDWSTIGWSCQDVADYGINRDLTYDATYATAQAADNTYWQRSNFDLTYAPSGTYKYASVDNKFRFNISLLYTGDISYRAGGSSGTEYDFTYLFYNCVSLKKIKSFTVENPMYIQNNSTEYMFANCYNLEAIPTLNQCITRWNRNANYMFYNCSKITTVPEMTFVDYNPSWTSGFQNCYSLVTVPALNISGSMQNMFNGCRSLTTIGECHMQSITNVTGAFTGCTSLTNLGGFTNLTGNLTWDFSASSVLTRQSVLNVFNGIGGGSGTIKLSSTTYGLLSAADLAIATDKGWSVISA